MQLNWLSTVLFFLIYNLWLLLYKAFCNKCKALHYRLQLCASLMNTLMTMQPHWASTRCNLTPVLQPSVKAARLQVLRRCNANCSIHYTEVSPETFQIQVDVTSANTGLVHSMGAEHLVGPGAGEATSGMKQDKSQWLEGIV